jgi:F-type H+-transporting ATPase subunit gamma
MQPKPATRIGLIAVTSDRGLAGGFNANVFRRIARFQVETPGTEISLFVVGKKGRDFFRRRNSKVRREFSGATGDLAAGRANELSHAAVQAFENNDLDAVYLVFNEFKSAIVQRVVAEQLLPVVAPPEQAAAADASGANANAKIDFLYEPGREELLSALIPLYLEAQIHRALLESIASEFGARMTAMDNATTNARDMIASYTLQYNRVRQAAITKELMEIVGGAEALKG